MWDVLEHLREPSKFLERARKLLKDEGWLVLKLPGFNPRTFDYIKLNSSLAGALLGAPDHIQYFTHKSLHHLLINCGFHNIKFYQRSSFRSKPKPKNINQKLKRTLMHFIIWTTKNSNLYVFCQPEKM